MKPCGNRQKALALLAMNLLDAAQAMETREHVSQCSRCREFFNQLSAVAGKLSMAAPKSDLEASEDFHRRLVAKLQSASKKDRPLEWRLAWRNIFPQWRIALPLVGGTAALAIMAFLILHEPGKINVGKPVAHSVAGVQPLPAQDPAPTFSQYQMAANVSLDALDDLLTRQGNRSLPAVPTYTAANLGAGE